MACVCLLVFGTVRLVPLRPGAAGALVGAAVVGGRGGLLPCRCGLPGLRAGLLRLDVDGRQRRQVRRSRGVGENRCGRNGTQRANVALHRSYSSKDVIRTWCWKRSRFGRAARGMCDAEPAGDGRPPPRGTRAQSMLAADAELARRQGALAPGRHGPAHRQAGSARDRPTCDPGHGRCRRSHRRSRSQTDRRRRKQRPRRRMPGRPATIARPARKPPQGRRATFRSDAMLAAVDARRPPQAV